MATLCQEIGLEFACSADFRDQLDMANLTPQQRSFCQAIEDKHLRQSVRDFMVNQQFRRDYWVRGAQVLDAPTHQALLAAQRVMLQTQAAQIPMTMTTVSSDITLNAQLYGPIIAVMSDLQAHTLGEIAGIVGNQHIGLQQVMEAVMMLIGGGHAAPLQADVDIVSSRAASAALNHHLIAQATLQGEIEYLASPATGGGVPVDRLQQLFLLAVLQEQQSAEDIVAFVWRHISALDKKLVKEGVRLESEEDNLAELMSQAQLFFLQRLPVLQALQVV